MHSWRRLPLIPTRWCAGAGSGCRTGPTRHRGLLALWENAISLPGTTSATKLLGLAESPSGNYLAVADYGGQAIYVLDPGDPSSARRVPMPKDYFAMALAAPAGVAVLDSGKVYITSNDVGGTGEMLVDVGHWQQRNDKGGQSGKWQRARSV